VIGEVLGEKPVIGVQRMGSAFSRSRASTERQALWDSWDLCDREPSPKSHLTSHISLPTVKSCLFTRVTFHFSRC
jgi:hypothetical protein